jgi:glutaredoxin
MDSARGHVAGPRQDHSVILYGLSTCGWCEQAKEFLTEQGVAFDFTYVDLLDGEDLEAAVGEVKKWLPDPVFPLVVVDGREVVAGFRQDRLEEVLGL